METDLPLHWQWPPTENLPVTSKNATHIACLTWLATTVEGGGSIVNVVNRKYIFRGEGKKLQRMVVEVVKL